MSWSGGILINRENPTNRVVVAVAGNSRRPILRRVPFLSYIWCPADEHTPTAVFLCGVFKVTARKYRVLQQSRGNRQS